MGPILTGSSGSLEWRDLQSGGMGVRFLHTSDWHLGRQFHGSSLVADQEIVLRELVSLAGHAEVDAVVIAGDLFDRAVPPTEAVRLLDDVLTHLILVRDIPVLAVAGNHDSPERLGFGSRLLAAKKLHVAGTPTPRPLSVTLTDRHGPVAFHLVPYAEPSVSRQVLGDPAIVDHDRALRAVVREIDRRPRSVVVAHAFVAGGEASESERPLSVGGAGTIGASAFDGFSYTALGHLHRPQSVGRETLRYSGSLLKYSFQEASHRKSVSIVEMDGAGACRVEEVVLSPRRDVRRLEGTLAEILGRSEGDTHREDYLEVSLRGREALLDPMDGLRRVYPNVLRVLRPDLEEPGDLRQPVGDMGPVTDEDLFASFFVQVTGGALEPPEREALRSVLESLQRKEREAPV
jgi:exonuclease SbcD